MKEIWLPVVGYEDSYEMSSLGRVRGLDRLVNRPNKDGVVFKMKVRGGVLSPSMSGNAKYESVQLCRDGVATRVDVHRIVAMAHVPGRRRDKTDVNHINGIKGDNSASNLEWVTRAENTQHAIRELGMSLDVWSCGEGNPASKLDEDSVRVIRSSKLSNRKLASKFGVSSQTIRSVRAGRTWKHVS